MDDLKSAKWELADFVSFIELSDELVGKHAARPKGFSSERTVYHNFRSKDTTAIDFRIWRILLKKSADSPMGAGVRRRKGSWFGGALLLLGIELEETLLIVVIFFRIEIVLYGRRTGADDGGNNCGGFGGNGKVVITPAP